MNLRKLSDDQLLTNTENLVHREREILAEVLRHLREVERRKLYAREKCTSLFQFCTERLKYSPDQAQRRIVAARLLEEMPEIEEKVADGRLTLSHLNLAARAFKVESSREVRSEIVAAIESTSQRVAEQRVAEFVPLPKVVDRVKVVNAETIEIKFAATPQFEEKLQRLRGRLAHKMPEAAMAQILEAALDLALAETDPARAPKSKSPATSKGTARRTIPRATRRIVFQRSAGKCENCGSRHKLEVDHVRPWAKGGISAAENLRVLCRNCNMRAAIEQGLTSITLNVAGNDRLATSQKLSRNPAHFDGG